MKIGIGQIAISRGKPSHNLNLIEGLAKHASEAGADLLCLPEMVTTGFDWKRNRELLAEASQHHEAIAQMARSYAIAICGSFLECAESGMPCNTLLYFDNKGSLLAKYRKVHLFTLFREDEHVQAGDTIVVADIGHAIAGFGVCYDLRFPELFSKNTEMGAEIQILAAAFPHPRLEHWRTLVRARAIENQCFFIAVNQSGKEHHDAGVGAAHYFGHSMVVDPWGEILLELGEEEDLQILEIDLSQVTLTRSKLSALSDRRPELYSKSGS
ncbi:MAG: nitrilase-related carbon-nitrogen hydrolase [Opitutales bacterium]